jgi:asparagine synthase (glutamine-hydrolysing)
VRLVTRLHQWDVLRANKAPFAFGLETRVPFLDKQFLQARSTQSSRGAATPLVHGAQPCSHARPNASLAVRELSAWFAAVQVSMNIDAADKMPNLSVKPDGVHPKLEKYILRKVRQAPPRRPPQLATRHLAGQHASTGQSLYVALPVHDTYP